MTAVANFKAINDACAAGRCKIASWRKAPTQTTGTGIWFDLSMSPGNPVPNYYAAAPLVWTTLRQSTDYGLPHGGNVSPATKYLQKLMIAPMAVATLAPSVMMLLDYVGYYPFVDMADFIEFGATTLPRYTDGVGLQIMAVEVASQIGGAASFYLNYTNSEGVAGRQTATVFCNTQTVNGTIINSAAAPAAGYPSGPFIPLQAGDTGVRSIESVTWLTSDVGLVTFVLVKPLATIAMEQISNSIYTPKEVDFAIQNAGKMPVIPDDAYLNFICLPTGTLSGGQFYGTIETIWSA
jgi:hypothetical protein